MNNKPYIAPNGKVYASLAEMYRAYGINPKTGKWRRSAGWSIEEILGLTPRKSNSMKPAKPIKTWKDHLGNTYNSLKEMAEAYDLNEDVLCMRLHRKWPIEEALTFPEGYRRSHLYTDHIGNKYMSIKDMCLRYGISYCTYYYRNKYGWDIERILTEPVKHIVYKMADPFASRRKPCKDHNGVEYASIGEMCKNNNISQSLYCYRIKSGFTLKQALTNPK